MRTNTLALTGLTEGLGSQALKCHLCITARSRNRQRGEYTDLILFKQLLLAANADSLFIASYSGIAHEQRVAAHETVIDTAA